MITLQEESFSNAKEDFKPLLDLHWNEIARHKDDIKLNVDYESYRTLEELGLLHCVTARDEGKLIGYVISMVSRSLHYSDHLFANNDVLFIHPDYRGGSTFVKMLKFTERKLKQAGIKNFYIHMKLDYDFSALLERYGFTEIERNFEKQLG